MQQQIACISKCNSPKITLNFQDVQRQSGSNDCGAFAVAFATALCSGCHPGKCFYDQKQMRQHLMKCLQNGYMEQFPVKRYRRLLHTDSCTQSFEVYCLCRMPRMAGESMIACARCEMWYHADICIEVPKNAWKPNMKWLCNNCAAL